MLTNNTQLDKYTPPCLNKATNSLLSSSNTELMDVRNDPKQQNQKKTRSESDNSDNALSPTQENLAATRTIAKASKSNDDTQKSHQTLDDASALADSEGRVTAVVAKVKYEATKSQARRKIEHPGRRCTSNNIIKVLAYYRSTIIT